MNSLPSLCCLISLKSVSLHLIKPSCAEPRENWLLATSLTSAAVPLPWHSHTGLPSVCRPCQARACAGALHLLCHPPGMLSLLTQAWLPPFHTFRSQFKIHLLEEALTSRTKREPLSITLPYLIFLRAQSNS